MSQEPQPQPQPDHNQILTQAMFTSPNIYANGFSTTTNNIDVTIACLWNGKSTAAITVPLATAKSMSVALAEVVAQVEKRLGAAIPTIAEVLALPEG